MATVTYTTRASLPITYQWKCSECGAINRASVTVEAKDESISAGKKYKYSFATSTTFMAKNKLMDLLEVLCGKRGSIQQYRELGLYHACEKCGHKEPWAVKNYTDINDTIKKACIYSIGFIVLGLFLSPVCFVLAILMGAGYAINKTWNEKYIEKKEKEISMLPFSCLPVLVNNNMPIVDLDALEEEELPDPNIFIQ